MIRFCESFGLTVTSGSPAILQERASKAWVMFVSKVLGRSGEFAAADEGASADKRNAPMPNDLNMALTCDPNLLSRVLLKLVRLVTTELD
jgi:hypothetical protein